MNENEQIEYEKKKQENIVSNFFSRKINDKYMLTISRDGENPPRSIYLFSDLMEAVEAYNCYTNWGFSKNFLTVTLYDAYGEAHTKILRRPPAGECSYVRQNYLDAIKLLLSLKDKMNENVYKELVFGFANIFSLDNIRFNPERFLSELEYEENK